MQLETTVLVLWSTTPSSVQLPLFSQAQITIYYEKCKTVKLLQILQKNDASLYNTQRCIIITQTCTSRVDPASRSSVAKNTREISAISSSSNLKVYSMV